MKATIAKTFLSCDGSDRIRYETTGNRRRSWHVTEIGTIVIHPLTLHDYLLAVVFFWRHTKDHHKNGTNCLPAWHAVR